ncbi:MAG: response regulator [Candidatus Omnitrophica bacterium]|nr:response regulator [Candidatus Omnitrophota bacterium]
MSETRHRILFVDDEASLAKVIGQSLQVAGFDVIGAKDGEEGLAKARQERPDCVVLDLMLPKLSGLKVCVALKQDPQCQAIPVVIFTGKDDLVDDAACRAAGANAVIPKALGASVLVSEIQALLQRPSQSTPVDSPQP